VICTAYSDYSWKDISTRLGHAGQLLILRKPFDPIEAVQMASMLCEKWSAHRREAEQLASLDQLVSERTAQALDAENKLRQAHKMEAVGQLAAGVAHDFNKIMTVILGHISTCLLEPTLPATVREALESTRTASTRAASLTRQLLAFGRKQVMQIQPWDAAFLVHQNIDMLCRLIGTHISVDTDLPSNLGKLMADANSFHQIMLNLAINARDAMPQGGKITIRANHVDARQHSNSREGDFMCITFQDTGVGMDEITRTHLFEPFFTTKGVGEGTGLGLATVHGLMAQHGGWIDCESRPGAGAAFHLYFPLATETATRAPQTAPDSVPPQLMSGASILVVEDETAIRTMLSTILRKLGFHVTEAANAAEALQIWSQQTHPAAIDILFTDVVMPGGMSGLQLARELRSQRPELKVIISSGYNTEMLEQNVSGESGGYYLPKPYDLQAVTEMMRHVLVPCQAALSA
jgi:signal transduction histidine kinase/CheY-like chemotaxis protein